VQRGTQAVIWGIPLVAMQAFRESAVHELGATFNDIIYMSRPPAPRQAFLTPTNETPYVMLMLNTGDGPVVVEIPPASKTTLFFGTLADAWQFPLTDVGPSGEDAGKGGKYLFLPPGYKGDVPTGYFVFRSNTTHLYAALRPVSINGGTLAQAVAYSQTLKAYPLAQAAAPPPNRYIDASPISWNTLPQYDLSYFKLLSAAINDEPVQTRDLAMMGLLSSVGINKGQPFNPDPSTANALTQAASDGYDQMQRYFITPGKSFAPMWPGNQWQVFNVPRDQMVAGFPFETPDRLMIDERAGGYFGLAFFPKTLGKASFYLIGLRDQTGTLLDGKSTYRLRVPKDVPAAQFWSATVYDMKTKAMFANADRVSISSTQKSDLKVNADGSIDIYFGPKAPTDLASNWIPTGNDFFLWFRLYGPEERLFTKSWTLPDVERVAQ
jgi:hypothetical protein